MSDEPPNRTPARRWLVPLLVLLALGTAFYLWTPGTPEPVSPSVVLAPAADPAAHAAAPGDEAADEAEPPAPQALVEAPGFDLVRVDPDGGAVVAGRAAPGAAVTIYADAAPIAEVAADEHGNFVAIFRAEPARVPQALTLGATTDAGEEVISEDVVLLLPEAPPPEPAASAETILSEAVPATGTEAAPDPIELALAVPAEAGPPVVEAPAEAAATEPPPASGAPGPRPRVAATAILRAGEVEVVGGERVPARQVSLASISYASDGEVLLAGLGTAGARLRAYVDDGFAEEGEVGGDGRWTLALGDVDAGLYRLRIDQIDATGQVASRVETPFQRDLPRGPMPRPGAADPMGGERPLQVTVQPGTNLWTLARVHYGAGVLYSQIFTANQHLIRDPDLIYPGQIFDLPEVED